MNSARFELSQILIIDILLKFYTPLHPCHKSLRWNLLFSLGKTGQVMVYFPCASSLADVLCDRPSANFARRIDDSYPDRGVGLSEAQPFGRLCGISCNISPTFFGSWNFRLTQHMATVHRGSVSLVRSRPRSYAGETPLGYASPRVGPRASGGVWIRLYCPAIM